MSRCFLIVLLFRAILKAYRWMTNNFSSLIRSALAGPFIGIVPRIHTFPRDLPTPEEGLTHLSGIFSPSVVLQQSAFGASDSRVASGVHQASGRSPAGDLFFHSWLPQTGNCLSPSPHVISRGKATNDSAVVVPGGPLTFSGADNNGLPCFRMPEDVRRMQYSAFPAEANRVLR